MVNGLWVPTTRKELAEKMKLDRYATLTAGVYAWRHGRVGKCEEAGSGVFVAPGVVLTAKHVVNGMGTLDERWDRRRHETVDFDAPSFDIRLYQAPRWGETVLWYAKGSVVRSKDTDIAILPVEPENELSEWVAADALPEAFVPWRLEPPPKGAEVELYGWPKPTMEVTGEIHTGGVQWVQQHGVVTDVFDDMRDHVRVNFPSFRIDRPVEGAFSGGPVFYRGALVGITSISTEMEPGSDLIGDTYAASLWPLLLREFDYRGKKVTFGDLFDAGVIRALDHHNFRGRVVRTPCDRCLDNDPDHIGHAKWLDA
jgi:Trypsin-like peptidase domain